MKHATTFFAGLALGCTMLVAGCELIAAVDHDKIVGTGGGTSSTGTGTTTSTAAGCGLGTPCGMASDCTATTPDCVMPTCSMGCCGTADKSMGSPCSTNGKVCDGIGNCVACVVPSDCAAQTTACKLNTCTGFACGTMNAAKGLACSDSNGTVCDGNGACVAAHCTDNVIDADETDVDCGGSSCGACADTKKCKVGTDCTSKICDGTLHCAVPTCGDGVQNGNETDKDCGGGPYNGAAACAKCADTKNCLANTDCVNNLCFSAGTTKTCVSCMDNTKDGNETGSDCGGAQCDALGKTCANGTPCTTAADCTSGVCVGNTTCGTLADGSACTASAQCTNGNCVGPAGNQICCHTACNGTCVACTNALTTLADGTCGPIKPAGTTAPAGQCTASACGNDGKCDGSGACEQVTAGTACGSAACANGILTPIGMCSGGSCSTSGAACPNAVKCNAGGTACIAATCSMDSDCQLATNYCNASGACVPRQANGAACTLADQCTNMACVDGFCCGSACTTTCQACNVAGNLGACTNIPSGTQDTFPANACVGNNACDGNGACKSINGQSCASGTTCVTGNCVNTVCCASSSCGVCKTCNGAGPGTCSNVAQGSGDGATCTGNNACDGSGNCLLASGQACTMNTQCASGVCTGGTTCM